MSNGFLFFGCWNNGGCNPEDTTNQNSLTRVMKYLKKYIEDEENKPEFLIVAGDNYYPEKDKNNEKEKDKEKIKYYDEKHIDSGFNCLNEIKIEKYILLGNHDVEQTISKNGNNENIENTNKKKCNTLNYQVDNIRQNLFNFNNFDKSSLQTKMV